jgi:hypothetical protein
VRIALVLTRWQGMQDPALDGPPMRHRTRLSRRLTAAADARLWNRQPMTSEDLPSKDVASGGFGTSALRGYRT